MVSGHEHIGCSTTDPIPVEAVSPAQAWGESSAREPVRATALASGDTIGQYELIRLLGRGGMGEVHLARDLRLGRLVALKLLLAQQPRRNQRFLDEARATARCHHENIVVIHEVGEHEGRPYMVLEYLEGQTLRQWLREHTAATAGSGQRAPLPPGRAVELMLPVVRALVYAHELGIVHRDLKPENIMLTRSGIIKVLDFGLAKLLPGPTPDERSHAQGRAGTAEILSSALIGTPPYMSPEQMKVGVIDHRADLWAVGIMLFEMVTGAHPVPSRAMADLVRIAHAHTPMPSVRARLPELGPLGAVIDRCLLKDREHRTPTARALLTELEALVPGRHAAPVPEGGSPFAGLAAFQEADADRFFGRDREIEQLVSELRSRPLVAVVGPSGTGKSSLVRAGVIPALKRAGEGWDAYVVRPGREPLAALAAMLDGLAQAHGTSDVFGRHDIDVSSAPLGDSAASGVLGPGLGPVIERMRAEPGYLGAWLRARASSRLRHILVFVDQLEEVYTLGAPSDERAAFLSALIAVADDAASPLRVILAMRSDFLDRLTEDRRLGAEVTRGLVLLPPMGREGMCEALLRPVEAHEYRFESPALVDRMVDAVATTPGALPLLQFTAARLWELRDAGRRMLTEASYEQLGGVAGALATHADAVLAGMSSAQQHLARAVLERLVTPERTRALVSVAELRTLHRDPGVVDGIVQHLAAMRLLVIERGAEGADHTVELVHESLIERWPTLARWLSENQDAAAFLARLRGAAQEWEKSSRDEGLLWRGTPAQEARFWRAHHRDALSPREQDYLDSVFAMDTRTTRRRRRLVAGTILAVLLVAFAWIRTAEQEASQQAMLSRDLAQALQREQAQNHAAEQARREAEAARREAAVQSAGIREASHSDANLFSVWGTAPDDVFAVGFRGAGGSRSGTVLHYDGHAWQQVHTLPAGELYGVWATAPDDVFAVGAIFDGDVPASGIVLHYDGQSWQQVHALPKVELISIWAAAPDDVFAVGAVREGHVATSGIVLHYNGQSWQQVHAVPAGRLYGIWATAPDDVFAVGAIFAGDVATSGIVLHYDGRSWQQVHAFPAGRLHAVWASASDDVFAVGAGEGPAHDIVLHYDGQSWERMSSPINARLYGVWGSGPLSVFAVGSGGTVLHYDGQSWTPLRSRTSDYLISAWGPSAQETFFVGENGSIYHR